MKKRAGAGFALAVLLPLAAIVVLMTRVLEGWSRPAAFGLWGLGFLAFLFSVRRHRRTLVAVARGQRKAGAVWRSYRGPLFGLLAMLGSGSMLFTLVPVDRARFIAVEASALQAQIDVDFSEMSSIATRLREISERTAPLFAQQRAVMSAEHRGYLLGAWLSHLDHAVALDRIMSLHKYFYQIDPREYADLNARSFLIGYAALALQTRALSRLVRAVDDNRAVETLLDDPRPELGIEKGAYRRLKWRLTHPQTLLRLNAGRLHIKYLESRGRLRSPEERALLEDAKQDYRRLWSLLGREPELFADNPLEYLERKAYKAWFPVQKGIAEGMGKLRATQRENFVTVDALGALRPELQPGDILLERRNWYATNVGLPGFWPHAALYVGTPSELDAFFDGATERAVTAGLAPSVYIAGYLPALQHAFSEPDGGHPKRVIEAIAPGVTLTALEHSGNADYLAVLRPRLDKAAKLAALMRAFGFHGRPYDFEFDFVTDRALVCSELVYKAFESGPGKPGIDFTLTKVGGRLVLPPNEIARKFAVELGAQPQLDFVAFFDGIEAEGRAVRRDAAVFRETFRRPKWDHLQR